MAIACRELTGSTGAQADTEVLFVCTCMAVVVKAVLGSHFGVGEFTTHFRTYFSGCSLGVRDFDPLGLHGKGAFFFWPSPGTGLGGWLVGWLVGGRAGGRAGGWLVGWSHYILERPKRSASLNMSTIPN